MSRSVADETRDQIVSSLFSKFDENGTPEENLISYLRVHEDDRGSIKTRYLMLAVTKLGRCLIHKTKRNPNNTFSKGKTWNLEDLRQVEMTSPLEFALTMTSRTYRWSTDHSRDMTAFLNAIVKAYRTSMGRDPRTVNFPGDSSSLRSTVSDSPSKRLQSSTNSNATSSPRPSDRDVLLPPRAPGHRADRAGSFSSQASDASRSRQSPAYNYGVSPQTSNPPTAALRSAHRQGSTDSYTSTASYRTGGGRRPSAQSTDIPPVMAAPSGGRRPSAVSADIPPAIPEPAEDDPYGGMEETNGAPAKTNGSTGPPPTARAAVPATKASPKVSTSRLPTSGAARASPSVQPKALPDSSAATLTKSPKAAARAHFGEPSAEPEKPQQATQADGDKPKRRVSFVAPPLNTAYSRDVLLTSRTGLLGADVKLVDADDDEAGDAIMGNVEEMIKGFDWTTPAAAGDGSRDKNTNAIEARLLDELAALENANIHAFLESDDRVEQVLSHIDEALQELDEIDFQLTGYRLQLNAVNDDIDFIQGQNRGLQVQTANQHALLAEIRQLLQITEVPKSDIDKLLQASPSTPKGIQELEQAAASLYKALQAARDTANEAVAANMRDVEQYKASSGQFSTRIIEYLDIAFKHQSEKTLTEYRRVSAVKPPPLKLVPHTSLGEALMAYEGLVLYVKDMDEDRYKKLCLNYITAISKLHQSEMKDLLMQLIQSYNSSSTGVVGDAAFAKAVGSVQRSGTMVSRARTLKRPDKSVARKGKKTAEDGSAQKLAELYSQALGEVVNQIVTEEDFMNAFLHLNDNESTFADYMELDTYFRRQAARHASRGLSPALAQVARSTMDLTFGFVDGEFKHWVEAAIERNPVSVVGVIVITEQLSQEAEMEGTSRFLLQFFEKQLGRQHKAFDLFVNEQIKTIESAKSTTRKRKGVFFFVKHFPTFVERIESQLDNCDHLPIRKRVNDAYEKAVSAVLSSLQYVSKIVGAEMSSGEEKGQLYFHVVMIENLHMFIEDVSQLNVPGLAVYLQRAKGLYEENLKAYTKMMLRRGFAKLMDYFDGVERLLKTTPANEISVHHSYNRSALKKVLKESGSKDMRKAIEAMAKRVDKHFNADDESYTGVGGVGGGGGHHPNGGANDPATAALLASVWQELSSALEREIARDTEFMSKSYSDTGLSLEYGATDIGVVCSRSKLH